ncbi:glycosyltransferase [Candidatus Microgenomates bacterium]|nr:glycosyltransferase [Candidatus Microgenomates bacterium]
MEKATNNLLSVIVPAYKQEKTIKKDLENINETLQQGLPREFNYEIICVVDGSLDNTEHEAKKAISSKIHVYSYPDNAGKGYAVRFGMSKANGDLISFLDAGMEISPKGIMMLMAHMEWYNADIIVGSKRHPASQVKYPFARQIFSIGYHAMIKVLFGLWVNDTQSGIKIFKRKVIEKILPRLLVKRYAMDIEMLAVANYLGFKRIYEGPIEIHYKFEDLTHASTMRSIFRMVWDTFAVFYRLKILHYYDRKEA